MSQKNEIVISEVEISRLSKELEKQGEEYYLIKEVINRLIIVAGIPPEPNFIRLIESRDDTIIKKWFCWAALLFVLFINVKLFIFPVLVWIYLNSKHTEINWKLIAAYVLISASIGSVSQKQAIDDLIKMVEGLGKLDENND